jgi:hypothetical protein
VFHKNKPIGESWPVTWEWQRTVLKQKNWKKDADGNREEFYTYQNDDDYFLRHDGDCPQEHERKAEDSMKVYREEEPGGQPILSFKCRCMQIYQEELRLGSDKMEVAVCSG